MPTKTRVMCALTLGTLCACGGGTTEPQPPPPPPSANIVGTYDITRVNGQAPPVTLTDFISGVALFTLHSGEIGFENSGSYAVRADMTSLLSGSLSLVLQAGSWTQQGSDVVITPNDGTCPDRVVATGGALRIESDCLYRIEWLFQRR